MATRKKAGAAGPGKQGGDARDAKAPRPGTGKLKGVARKAAPVLGKVAKAVAPVLAKVGRAPAPKAASGPAADASGDSPLKVGQAAPGFRLPDETGREVSLGDYRGKKVVLYFYPKDSTPGCTQESCDFRDNLSRLGSKGAVVLGLSADSVESHRRFKEKQGLNFPLLSDPRRQALEAYGVWQEKSLYGRKFMGIVRTTVLIDEKGKVAKVWPKVKVTGHVDEVLAAL